MNSQEEENEKKLVKLEEVAEETGELIAKGVKKTWDIMKSFGKGFIDTLDSELDRRDIAFCPHCGTSLPSQSNFCADCGKKLKD